MKEKKLPELNDEFAKEAAGEKGGYYTLENCGRKFARISMRPRNKRKRRRRAKRFWRHSSSSTISRCPSADRRTDGRSARARVRSLAAQGVDPRAVNIDWVSMRQQTARQRCERCESRILLDRIASAEKIDASDEELDKEIASLAERSGESVTAFRARLTKQGALDRMKSKLRSDKVIDWLYRTSRIETTPQNES